ncbi:DsbE family thiol:disulfide interchange protein [Labrenzia aggregata]|uniref:DsbE family thiol:disulfide interchange protein n=2 Tax=Roseibium aggregatum TaxID=187304 RepID=A0A939J729_9HYPH|nr:DsbE family thiol:disulfide interchange protein [Roseibium aggregatum]
MKTSDDKPQKRGFPVLVLLPLVVFAALAGLFLFQLTLGNDPKEIPSALINKPAPDFTLQAVEDLSKDGAPVPGFSSADLKGKVSVVNVFASWCVPCRQEHPLLEDLAKVDGIQLLGINYKDKPENARRFLGSLGNPYSRIGADSSGRAAIDWGVYGVPETFVIDETGTIRYKFIGPLNPVAYRDEFLPQLRKIIEGN